MGAVAAVLIHAQAAALQAHIVLLRQAGAAYAAAHPGEDDADIADLHAGGIRAEPDDAADDLMPHGQRQHHAAVLQVHLLAAAQVVIAFPDMQV
jgi:hypothetical protein